MAEKQDACDAQCRQDKVLAAWETDRASVPGLVRELPDPIERVAVISRLIDRHPAQVESLCPELPEGPSRGRCREGVERAHLQSRADWVIENQSERSRHISSSPVLTGTSLQRVEPVDSTCAEVADKNACRWAFARAAAKKGKAGLAAGLCLDIPIDDESGHSWRSECLFGAAEVITYAGGSTGYRDGIALCATAELYRANCVVHLLTSLTQGAPGANEVAPTSWAAISRSADEVSAVWREDSLHDEMVSSFWSLALAFSFSGAPVVSGDVLDVVPEQARPHVHAAAAMRILELEDPSSRNLTGWVDELEAALKSRVREPPSWRRRARKPAVVQLWQRRKAKAAGIPTDVYMETSRRVVSNDLRSDLAIAFLEAAARLESPPHAAIVEGMAHPDPLVQFTANQILHVLGPGPAPEPEEPPTSE